MSDRKLPFVGTPETNPETKPFWDGCAARKLVIPFCVDTKKPICACPRGQLQMQLDRLRSKGGDRLARRRGGVDEAALVGPQLVARRQQHVALQDRVAVHGFLHAHLAQAVQARGERLREAGAPRELVTQVMDLVGDDELPAANALVGWLTPAAERGLVYGMISSAYFVGNTLGDQQGLFQVGFCHGKSEVSQT